MICWFLTGEDLILFRNLYVGYKIKLRTVKLNYVIGIVVATYDPLIATNSMHEKSRYK